MAITSTDDIFITYERDLHTGGDIDVMLAKMDADSLKLGSAQPVRFGSLGAANSLGGVRIDPDAVKRATSFFPFGGGMGSPGGNL